MEIQNINEKNILVPFYELPMHRTCFSLVHFECLRCLKSLFQFSEVCRSSAFEHPCKRPDQLDAETGNYAIQTKTIRKITYWVAMLYFQLHIIANNITGLGICMVAMKLHHSKLDQEISRIRQKMMDIQQCRLHRTKKTNEHQQIIG